MNSHTRWQLWKDKKTKKWIGFCQQHNKLIEFKYALFSYRAYNKVIQEIISKVEAARMTTGSNIFKIRNRKTESGRQIDIVQHCNNVSYFSRIDITINNKTNRRY
jgi:hypothetical protein